MNLKSLLDFGASLQLAKKMMDQIDLDGSRTVRCAKSKLIVEATGGLKTKQY
jgi:hypothetical protein